MAARRSDIVAGKVFKGSTASLSFTIKDDADALVDITGWTFSFRVSSTEEDAVSDVTVAGVNAGSSVATVAIAADTFDDLDPGTYWYNLWRTNSGSERVLAYGSLHIGGSVRI